MDDAYKVITFKHPTIGDALSSILGDADATKELYLRGARPEVILTEVVCASAPRIEDAIVIDGGLEEILVERLAEVPDEPATNKSLFAFLAERTSDAAFRRAITCYPAMLNRGAYTSHYANYDPKMLTHARALRHGLLPEKIKAESGERLEAHIVEDMDASFIENDDLLALIAPTKVLRLSRRLKDEFLDRVPAIAEAIVEGAILDIEPKDNFDDLVSAVRTAEDLLRGDTSARDLIIEAERAISSAIDDVKAKKAERDRDDEYQWDWYEGKGPEAPQSTLHVNARSIFSDVDE